MMKVSVLVPIYGVEKYIEQCAKTLFAQTYADIEYVFVDDCTPDRSVEVLHTIVRPCLRRDPHPASFPGARCARATPVPPWPSQTSSEAYSHKARAMHYG